MLPWEITEYIKLIILIVTLTMLPELVFAR